MSFLEGARYLMFQLKQLWTNLNNSQTLSTALQQTSILLYRPLNKMLPPNSFLRKPHKIDSVYK